MIIENIKLFFDYDNIGFKFYEFSIQHLIAFVIFAVIPIFFLYLFKGKLNDWRYERQFAIFVGVFGLAIELLQYFWHYYGGQTDWRQIYPTTLCGLTIYISSIAMISCNKYLSSIVYFYSYGAFFSFLLPGLEFGFNRFRFYAYFVIHGLILFNTAYLILIRGIKVDKKAMIHSFILLFPILILSIWFNEIFSDAKLALNFYYLGYPPFEFPVYSWIYGISKYLYTAAVFISYYLLMLIMLGISAFFNRMRKRNVNQVKA